MLERLETASWNVWNKVRSGEVDVAGMGPDAGAIFGLIAPEFGEPVFGEHFLAPKLLQYVEAFLGEELRLGYVHLRNARGTDVPAGTGTSGGRTAPRKRFCQC